jgi:hypothetical protein
VQRLLGFPLDGKTRDPVALQALIAALDRAGLTVKSALEVEITAKPWEIVLQAVVGEIESGSRSDYRKSVGKEK